jgi:hypothetical protein
MSGHQENCHHFFNRIISIHLNDIVSKSFFLIEAFVRTQLAQISFSSIIWFTSHPMAIQVKAVPLEIFSEEIGTIPQCCEDIICMDMTSLSKNIIKRLMLPFKLQIELIE